MKTTIVDIAKACGVSPATVSLSLSNRPSRVSAETRKKVLEAAQALQYTPNYAAVSLVTKRTRLIGIIISDLRNMHIARQFMAIDEVLQQFGYTLVCHILDNTRGDAKRIVNDLIGTGVEGIIFAQPAFAQEYEGSAPLNDYLNSSGIPVMCNDYFNLTCPGADICFDFRKGAYLATRHLIECGHSRIGSVSGPPEYRVSIARLEGYKNALEEAGLPFEPNLVYKGDYSMRGARQALAYLMGQGATAIFSFNDEMAFAIYQSARQYAVNIPSDISVIGCDDVPFSDVLEVPLSTVHVPTEEMGKFLAGELIACIKNGSKGKRKTIWYEPALILRGSVSKRTSIIRQG
jgi:LacI family transcriptional regulator